MNINISKEKSLIIQSCCIQPDPQQLAGIEHLLSMTLDWNYIYNIATMHGIENLLYHNILLCKNNDLVPANIIEKFKKCYMINAYKNMILLNEYYKIVNHFHAQKIKIIPLKGIGLLRSIYQDNIALRSLNDIDILIIKNDFTKAREKMMDMSYQVMPAVFFMRGKHFHEVFHKKANNLHIAVEIHWDLTVQDCKYEININDFWDRAEKVNANGLSYSLSLEDSILADSFHVLRDQNMVAPLKNLCDLFEVIKKYADIINWEIIIQRAEKYQIARPILLVLLLLKELFNAPINYDILERIKKEGFQDKMLFSLVTEKIFKKPTESFSGSSLFTFKISLQESSIAISPINALKELYMTVRVKFDKCQSTRKALKSIFITIVGSFLSCSKIFFYYIFDHKNIKMQIQKDMQLKEELKNIDRWMQKIL